MPPLPLELFASLPPAVQAYIRAIEAIVAQIPKLEARVAELESQPKLDSTNSSQALTNPLLSRYVFNAQTFSTIGMECIESTHCLETIVNRNVPKPAPEGSITMKQK